MELATETMAYVGIILLAVAQSLWQHETHAIVQYIKGLFGLTRKRLASSGAK